MDDIKNNPFLSAYVAILVIGAGVLGFFAYKAYSGYKESVSEYESVKSTVEGLKGQDFFPNAANADARKKDVKEFTEKVKALEATLYEYQPDLSEELDVPSLQQKIRQNIEEVRDSATLEGVEIVNADSFRLGMAGPLTIPPIADAVSDLEFQLTGARQLADLLIASGVTSIDSMGREELKIEKPPVEEDNSSRSRRNRNRNKSNTKEPKVKEEEVIKRYPLNVIFTGDMDAVTNVLNNLGKTEPGSVFLSTRFMRLENEKKEGPEKDFSQSVETIGDEDTDAITSIAGDEAVRVQLIVDAIRFVSREEAEAAKKAAKENAKNAA